MLPLRVWVHCPRASNGLLPPRSYLVGYMRWHAWSDSGFIPPSDNHSNSFQFSVRRSANLTLGLLHVCPSLVKDLWPCARVAQRSHRDWIGTEEFRFQKSEGVASKSASSARLRNATQ